MQNKDRVPRRHRLRGLEVVFEDRDLIVVEKPAGLLTMSPHKDQPDTVERILTAYLRKGSTRSRLRAYVVHRLDRETSGLLVFAKSERVQQQLKHSWRDTDKRYFAVVHGQLAKKKGTISSYLAEDRDQFVHSTKNAAEGKWAETEYVVLRETPQFSALVVTLLTGRKNQIRVHFSESGHPVVGDPKYGRKEKKAVRMALHAMHLAFDHPYSGRRMVFDSPVPEPIIRLVGGLPAMSLANSFLALKLKTR